MSFLPIAFLGYIFNGTAILVDKLLVDTRIPNPIVYTFYLSLLTPVTLALVPFGFVMPTLYTLALGILAAVTYITALLIFYTALKHDEASRVSPVVGVFTPLFALVLGQLIFFQLLSPRQTAASILLILGLITLSSTAWFKNRLERKHLAFMAGAGLFFAFSMLILREVFLTTNFITGLVISRVPMSFLALTFLLSKDAREQIFANRITKNHFVNKTSQILFLGQISGALGGFLISYAIFLINPAVVTSMQGVQYMFILLVVLLLSKKYQSLLDEHFTKKVVLQKVIGAAIIFLGLFILAT